MSRSWFSLSAVECLGDAVGHGDHLVVMVVAVQPQSTGQRLGVVPLTWQVLATKRQRLLKGVGRDGLQPA
ncbi:hypothetical protein [Aeromonas sp.]|uniref:hypothetical protein n=1 Tax=Aeromonas sp. TaxID=647 RepID=UPI00258DE06A|nr:hypothetical protein [Aeromonas sp.]MCX7132477.1 hypothetical protein [Aeromonas sp.]